jgi:uncharacterized membrane protein
MKVAHSCLPVLQGDCHSQPSDPNEEDVRICSHSIPQFLLFYGLGAVIVVLNVAALAILQTSPSESRVTCILVAMVNTVIAITSLVLTMTGLFVAIRMTTPHRFNSGPTALRFRRDTFQIGMALTVGFSVGGMLCILLAHLIHPTQRALSIFLMIAVRTTFIYYVAVFALLWLLRKCSCVSGIVPKRKSEESDTTEEEYSNGVEYLLLL